MPIQLEIVAKPELFKNSGMNPERYDEYFRSPVSYSFPSNINIDWSVLGSLAKQIYIASMRQELGDEFIEGKAPITTEFFDRWWAIKISRDAQEDDLRKCEDVPASDAFDRLVRSEREHIFLLQSDDVQDELKKMLEVDDRPQGAQSGGLLYAETDYFTPFPDPKTVFAEDVETHLKYLLPIATVSLKHINPAWEGSIHFVQPIEPYDECVGYRTATHHSSLCRTNWVGYRMDEHGKYTLATDWDYFLLSNLDTRRDFQPGTDEKQELCNFYEEARLSYATKRDHFRRYHAIHPLYSLEEYGAYRDRDRIELVSQLGGKPGWGNWTGIGDWPLSEHECDESDEFPDETYPLPQAEDGTDFCYIGWLASYAYGDTSGYNIELFYHPELRLALTTFDWS